MKTAEEHIKEHLPDCHEWADWGMEAIVKAMKAYAREAIAEHLERAADAAVSWIQNPSDRGPAHEEIVSTEIILK